jgi:hypothetical protein
MITKLPSGAHPRLDRAPRRPLELGIAAPGARGSRADDQSQGPPPG